MARAGLKTIILLSFVLAISFLLVILSCALYHNWLPLLVAVIFALAPLPNALAASCTANSDFSADYSSAPRDFASFVTSISLVSGFALPAVWAHAGIIHETAAWMCAIGGAVGYATVITYSHFFAIQIETY